MRSPLWFVVAAAIAILGFVGAGLYVWLRLDRFDLHVTRVVLPGSQIVHLDRAGPYMLYFEKRTFIDGQFTQSKVPEGLRVTLSSVATGTPVDLADSKSSVTYSLQGRDGEAILGFTISKPGQYRLAASLPSGRTEPKFVLAVGYGSGPTLIAGMFRTIGVAMALVFGGLGIASVIVAVTAVQRDKARRAASPPLGDRGCVSGDGPRSAVSPPR